jgi:hypothetical protein
MLFLDFLATGESPICLADAAKLLPHKPNGKHLSIRAIERYILSGYGPDGAKVFLEGARVANSWATSREALQRFVKACTDADQERRQLPPAASKPAADKPIPARGQRASRARRELEAAGFGPKQK